MTTIVYKERPVAPADRDVEVTVTVTFKESELKEARQGSRLGVTLADRFYDEIDAADWQEVYGKYDSGF